MFAVYVPARGEPRTINPSVLWDLRPAESTEPLDELPDLDRVMDFLVTGPLQEFREELLRERQREAEIKRKYGLRSLERLIMESEAKLVDYELRRAMGEEIPEPTILNEMRQKEELLERKRKLEEEISRGTKLLPSMPEVLGIIRVIPAPGGEYVPPDPELEEIGMRVAMEYERSQGRTPRDVSAENRGYDIVSTAPDGSVRYIEVKAKARTGPIALTPNEWFMARRMGDDYWLYIVENARTSPKLHRIRNPAQRLEAEEIRGVVRYIVRDWHIAYGEGDHA